MKRAESFSSAQIGVIRMVAGLRGGCPPKRPATWTSLVRRGVLVLTKASNGTPIHAFTRYGWQIVREMQAADAVSKDGAQ